MFALIEIAKHFVIFFLYFSTASEDLNLPEFSVKDITLNNVKSRRHLSCGKVYLQSAFFNASFIVLFDYFPQHFINEICNNLNFDSFHSYSNYYKDGRKDNQCVKLIIDSNSSR